jgi:hypothetical protein
VRTKAGRYTLEDRVLDGPGWSSWRGYDGVLRRPVGLLCLDPGHPGSDELLAAARASAAVEDPRLQRVLDVLEDDEGVCLVVEWMSGTTVEELLDDGPLPDVESWRVTLESARVLALADAQGLHHGALAPRWVLRGDGGRIRVLGLCVAGALDHPGVPDGPLGDVRGLGELLYAALTGRWPGDPARCALPAAPTQGGRPVRPRMVRAGVPGALDDVAARALGLPGRAGPLLTAAEVVAALEQAGRRMDGFDATGPIELDPALLAELDGTGYVARVTAELAEPPARTPSAGRRTAGAVTAAVCGLVLVVATVVGVLALRPDTAVVAGPPAGPTAAAGSSTAAPEPSAQIPVVAVTDFDPKPGNGVENPTETRFAIDGKASTAWHTVTYFRRPDLGGLKQGVGLLLDLGSEQEVAAVRLQLVGHGTSVQLRAANTKGTQADDFVGVAQSDDPFWGLTLTLRPTAPPLKTRYLLVWLTSLPEITGPGTDPNKPTYQGGIAEIQVFRR